MFNCLAGCLINIREKLSWNTILLLNGSGSFVNCIFIHETSGSFVWKIFFFIWYVLISLNLTTWSCLNEKNEVNELNNLIQTSGSFICSFYFLNLSVFVSVLPISLSCLKANFQNHVLVTNKIFINTNARTDSRNNSRTNFMYITIFLSFTKQQIYISVTNKKCINTNTRIDTRTNSRTNITYISKFLYHLLNNHKGILIIMVLGAI